LERAKPDSVFDTINLGDDHSAAKPKPRGGPLRHLKSEADVLRFAAGLEHGAVSAYLGAFQLSAIVSWRKLPRAFSATRLSTGRCF
jgi:hypothetical protein